MGMRKFRDMAEKSELRQVLGTVKVEFQIMRNDKQKPMSRGSIQDSLILAIKHSRAALVRIGNREQVIAWLVCQIWGERIHQHLLEIGLKDEDLQDMLAEAKVNLE